MASKRLMVRDGGLQREARAGDGLASPVIGVDATAGVSVLTAALISGGIIRRTLDQARTDTTDTAANILALTPNLDIGESYMFQISNTAAFILTLTAGVGVTLAGFTTIAASGNRHFVVTRTGAATITITGL